MSFSNNNSNRNSGSRTMSICRDILDNTPRFLSAEQLSRLVTKQLEHEKRLQEQNQQQSQNQNQQHQHHNQGEQNTRISSSTIRTEIHSDIRHHPTSSPFREFFHRFCSAKREFDALCNTLISPPYRARGLKMLTDPVVLWYLPAECEANFLEVRPSTIPNTGLGLFLRNDCPGFPQGAVLCEYRGQRVENQKQFKGNQVDYSVKLNRGDFISGVDEEGQLLSIAPCANDNGLAGRNVSMQEFFSASSKKSSKSASSASDSTSPDSMSNRAFYISTRDILPGEEIFVTYGADFWGEKNYQDIALKRQEAIEDNSRKKKNEQLKQKKNQNQNQNQQQNSKSKNKEEEKGKEETRRRDPRRGREELILEEFKCRACGKYFLNRLQIVHQGCGLCEADYLERCENFQIEEEQRQLEQSENIFFLSASSASSSHSTSSAGVVQISMASRKKKKHKKQQQQQQQQQTRQARDDDEDDENEDENEDDSNNSNQKKRKTIVEVLPHNEFTEVLVDGETTDGIRLAASISSFSEHALEEKRKQQKERKDWCLSRAMAFSRYQSSFSHAEEDDDGNDETYQEEDDEDESDDHLESEKRSTSSTACSSSSSSSYASKTSSSSSSSSTGFYNDRVRTLPILKDAESYVAPVAADHS